MSYYSISWYTMTSKKTKPTRHALYRQVLRLTKKLNVDPAFYKQRYRTATSDYWKQERDALRHAYVQTYRQTRRKKTNPAFMSDLNLNIYKTQFSSLRNGDLTVQEKSIPYLKSTNWTFTKAI